MSVDRTLMATKVARVDWYGSGNNPRENFSKMAVSEEVAENLSALDAKTVDEGTVVELLRKRYNRAEVYVSGFDLLSLRSLKVVRNICNSIEWPLLFCRVRFEKDVSQVKHYWCANLSFCRWPSEISCCWWIHLNLYQSMILR